MFKTIFLAPLILALTLCAGTSAQTGGTTSPEFDESHGITIINSYNEKKVIDALASADEKTLVVFDVDETLIKRPRIYMETKKYVETKKNKDIKLIEDCIPQMISNLQSRGVKVIALTKFDTGHNPLIKSIFGYESCEEMRYEQLKAVGINFAKPMKKLLPEYINFDEANILGQNPPVFYKGIMCNGSFPDKGDVLEILLEKLAQTTNFYPSKVIFFDDQQRNVTSVSNKMKTLEIPSTSFLYTGGNNPIPRAQRHLRRIMGPRYA
ncbi:DUF2608 domain-containing protein [bacterium]|nr:DUF2608 domain-containing protein [bacterium]